MLKQIPEHSVSKTDLEPMPVFLYDVPVGMVVGLEGEYRAQQNEEYVLCVDGKSWYTFRRDFEVIPIMKEYRAGNFHRVTCYKRKIPT